MSRSLLLVAYHFPPDNAVGSLRPARFAKYLPPLGWQCRVITAAPEVEESEFPQVLRVGDRTRALWDEDLGAATLPTLLQKYGEILARKLVFPGALGLTWSLETARVAEEQFFKGSHPPSAVLSSFPPLAAHISGWRIARKMSIPWIADFRDPYVTIPPWQPHYLQQRIGALLESRFVKDASAIIINTEAAAEQYRARYPHLADRIFVIWNGFDPAETLGALPIPRRAKKVVVHAGALYAGRNPIPILESLQRLVDAQVPEALEVEVALVGPDNSSAAERTAIHRAIAKGIATLECRKIPQAEARCLIQEADGLLLLQPQSSVLVPGKLFEYVRIGRPILSLAPKDSQIEWLLDRCGIPHVDVYPDDAPGEIDRKVTDYLRLPSDPVSPSAWFAENFNASRQAAQLAEILDRVTTAGKG